MANFRILSENFIPGSSQITVTSQKTGVVTNPIKDGTGTAQMLTTGAYSTGIDNQYKIEIESLSSLGIGTAKFRWSRNDTIIASSVVTSTAPVVIENGITVLWSTISVGGTDAFGSTLDKWTFEGKNLFGFNQMIDRKRNTRWRSATHSTVQNVTVDLGSAKTVQALILYDHNLTSDASIFLLGSSDSGFPGDATSQPFNDVVSWEESKKLHYTVNTSNTKQFWRIQVNDTANPSSFIEIGELFLGPFDEMVRNAAVGYSQTEKVIGSRNVDVYGVEDNRFRNRQKTWKYTLPASTDIQTLEGVFDDIYSSTDGKYDPVWINPTSNSTDFHMVFFDSIPLVHDFRENKTITLNFREVLKSN